MIDAKRGYWHIEIKGADQDNTAFTSPHGLCCFIRMRFSLQNDTGTFQRTMDVVLSGVKWKLALFT